MKWLAISFLITFLPMILGYFSIQITFHFIDRLNEWIIKSEKRRQNPKKII